MEDKDKTQQVTICSVFQFLLLPAPCIYRYGLGRGRIGSSGAAGGKCSCL